MDELHKNPYSPDDPRITELCKKSELVKKDMQKLRDDFKRKHDMLLEVQENHLKSYEMAIKNLKDKCTHKYADGKPASSLTHKDRIEWLPDNTMRRISFCELCGSKFDNGVIHIEENAQNALRGKMDQLLISDSDFENYIDNDDEEFIENIKFDPNWTPNAGIQLINVVGDRIRNNANIQFIDIDNMSQAEMQDLRNVFGTDIEFEEEE